MHNRSNRKWYILYPEDKFKSSWDLIISINLIFMCFYTPVCIAFTPEQFDTKGSNQYNIHLIMDCIFGLDIIIVFFSAFFDNDFHIHDDLSTIAQRYLVGWFLIDVVAIIPFNELFDNTSH